MTATTDTNPPTGPDGPAERAAPGTGEAVLLKVAAGRAAGRPECLAWVLARFQEDERMSDRALARRLGVGPAVLLRLRLCLRPREDRFVGDVEEIADACGVDADALIEVIRAVEVAETMRRKIGGHVAAAGAPDAGRLLAARERRPKKRRKKDKDEGGRQKDE